MVEVITDYDERTLSVDCRRSSTRDRRPAQVFDAVAGFGPLQTYLDDPTVEEIWINEPARSSLPGEGARAHDDVPHR